MSILGIVVATVLAPISTDTLSWVLLLDDEIIVQAFFSTEPKQHMI